MGLFKCFGLFLWTYIYVLLVIEMLATGERRGRESDVSQTQVAVIAELLVYLSGP